VVDLRSCFGGLFDPALEVAEKLLGAGNRILSLRRRGGVEEVKVAKRGGSLGKMRKVVLVNGATASGCEVLAAAIAQGGRATIVGERTLGKGTVEQVVSLPGGRGLKLSAARFFGPGGEARQGKGIAPDVPVPGTESKTEGTGQKAPSPDEDPHLRAALTVLRL
jgi:carboxyl-terminal processing protease